MMIASIAHKGLKLLWEKDDPLKLSSAHVDKIRRILTALDAAKRLKYFVLYQGIDYMY